MPVKLSSVLRAGDYSIAYGPEVLQQEPELAVLIASAIAKWSVVSHGLNRLLVTISGSNANAAFGMFSNIISGPAQVDALRGAASAVLAGEKLDAFNTAMRVVTSQAKTRHKLAHRVWATCPQLPNSLLLIDTKDLADQMVGWAQYHEAFQQIVPGKSAPANLMQHLDRAMLPKDRIEVYKKADLEKINRDFVQISEIINSVDQLLGDNPYVPSDAELFDQLSKMHLYRAAAPQKPPGNKKSRPTPP